MKLVGKAKACPPLTFAERWWARRKRTFAHPAISYIAANKSLIASG
jgi:hypothetical protein